MNRLFLGRKKIIFIVVVLFLLIILLTFWFFKEQVKKEPQENLYRQIYTAATDIVAGTEITENMIIAEKIPGEMYSEKYLTDIRDIAGKKTNAVFKKGEVISSDKLEGINAQQNNYLKFSSHIPAGHRAVSIPVNYYGQHSLIGSGDKVDIILTYYQDSSGEFTSATVLQHKEIIRIGTQENSKDGDVADIAGKNAVSSNGSLFTGLFSEGGQSPANMLILTFYLTPEEAEKIILSLQLGTLNIAICPG